MLWLADFFLDMTILAMQGTKAMALGWLLLKVGATESGCRCDVKWKGAG